MVGQIAKDPGLPRVSAIAGSDEKWQMADRDSRFRCGPFNYKKEDVGATRRSTSIARNGIDINSENVGGEIHGLPSSPRLKTTFRAMRFAG